MTSERLAILAALCMALTGTGVYMFTNPPAPPVAPESPAPGTGAPRGTTAPRPAPSGRSEPPTAKEWSSASTSELKGATGLNCSAKVLREWLRVACEGANGDGGLPKDLRILGAKVLKSEVGSSGIAHAAWSTAHGTAYTAASSSITSLVCPFVEGVRIEAQFEWTNMTSTLLVAWPDGAAEPRFKGRFKQP